MSSEIYRGMRMVAGWIKPYLAHVENGDSDVRAASRVEVSSHVIKQRYMSDPTFAGEYDAAARKRETNPKYGRRSW